MRGMRGKVCDIDTEVNGLLTWDREHKFDVETIRRATLGEQRKWAGGVLGMAA